MTGNNQIIVNTEILSEKAMTVNTIISKLESNFNSMHDILNTTKVYWEGSAANAYRKLYPAYEKDVNEVFERLKKYPEELMEMAGIYKGHQAKSDNMLASLPADVIS